MQPTREILLQFETAYVKIIGLSGTDNVCEAT